MDFSDSYSEELMASRIHVLCCKGSHIHINITHESSDSYLYFISRMFKVVAVFRAFENEKLPSFFLTSLGVFHFFLKVMEFGVRC